MCAHLPCTAVWPDSKHGLYGPPMHLQPIVETAVVETGVTETVVAETISTAVAETAVAETTATAVAETTVVDTVEKEVTLDCPMQEALPNMAPPPPAAAIDLCIGDDAVHVDEATAVAGAAVATPSVDSKKIVQLCWLWRARSDSPGLA